MVFSNGIFSRSFPSISSILSIIFTLPHGSLSCPAISGPLICMYKISYPLSHASNAVLRIESRSVSNLAVDPSGIMPSNPSILAAPITVASSATTKPFTPNLCVKGTRSFGTMPAPRVMIIFPGSSPSLILSLFIGWSLST